MAASPKHPVPVFPLPGTVLFPHAVLPLHIFELRYRLLVREALAGERCIALATLRPGWERDYQGSPAFHDLGCLAGFEQAEWLPNDRYDLVVRGLVRVRFTRLVREFPFRASEVETLPATPFDADDPLAAMERTALLAVVRRLLPLGPEAWLMPPLPPPDTPFEATVATVAQAARLPVELKLDLLACDSVFERARRLRERLERWGAEPGAAGAGLN